MIMVGQSKRLSKPLSWGRREKAVVAALIGCVVLAAIGLGAYALTSGAPSRSDCVEVTFASTLGGATVHACGAHARHVCASGSFGPAGACATLASVGNFRQPPRPAHSTGVESQLPTVGQGVPSSLASLPV
jgi:hypothetical protein